MSKTLFEENQERLRLNKPMKPSNTTGNDIAKALTYVGDCIIYLTEALPKATGSPKPVKSNVRTTDHAEAGSEPEGKPNE